MSIIIIKAYQTIFLLIFIKKALHTDKTNLICTYFYCYLFRVS